MMEAFIAQIAFTHLEQKVRLKTETKLDKHFYVQMPKKDIKILKCKHGEKFHLLLMLT